MRKIVLLAVMMALAAMMLAAAPASAQEIEIENFGFFCDNDDDDGDGNEECEDIVVFFPFFNDFDEFCDNDDDEDFRCDDEDDLFGFGDGEQEAESGDIDQTFEVSGPGDNSNQTVGIQGVANTGNVQNAIGVGDDLDGDGFFDDAFCDFDDDDGDGNEECEDVVVILDDGFDGFCDEFCDNDDDDRDGREECEDIVVFFPFDDGFDFDGDIDFDGDFEIEDSGASIDLSPTQTIDSSQQVNQAAAASAFDVVVVDP